MSDFQMFKEYVRTDYKEIKNKVIQATDDFCDKHDYNAQQRSEIYAELFSMELLERYHNWLTNH